MRPAQQPGVAATAEASADGAPEQSRSTLRDSPELGKRHQPLPLVAEATEGLGTPFGTAGTSLGQDTHMQAAKGGSPFEGVLGGSAAPDTGSSRLQEGGDISPTAAAAAAVALAAASAQSAAVAAGMVAAGTSDGEQQQAQQARPPPLSLRQLRSLSSKSRRPEVWGWLKPAPGTKLQFVLLQGKGVAIGRGRDAYHERLPQLMMSRTHSARISPADSGGGSGGGSGGSGSSGGGGSRLPDTGPGGAAATGNTPPITTGSSTGTGWGGSSGGDRPDSTFVEVADGRVSRLHAWVKWDSRQQQAVLEDLSSNGTFHNGERLGRGRQAVLSDGDRISLVLSVAPLAEQAFIYHKGDPRSMDAEAVAQWMEDAGKLWHQAPAASGSPTAAAAAGSNGGSGSGSGQEPAGSLSRRASSTFGTRDSGARSAAAAAAAARNLSRSKTSVYSTLYATTLDDLQCQICLSTLRDCVALEPCGHNFCAACLSHHLAALLASGQPLSCPLRCTPPERVIINAAVRQLLVSQHNRPLQLPLQQQRRQQLGSLEPLPEGFASNSGGGGSGGNSFASSSRLQSHGSASSFNQGLHHHHHRQQEQQLSQQPSEQQQQQQAEQQQPQHQQLLDAQHAQLPQHDLDSAALPAPHGPASASGTPCSGARAAAAAAAAAGGASPEYRHVCLLPADAAGETLGSPPASPFESAASRLSQFDSFELSPEDAAQAAALVAAPTMPAATALCGRSSGAEASGDAAQVVALVSAPTMPAAALPGHTSLGGAPDDAAEAAAAAAAAPTKPAGSPFGGGASSASAGVVDLGPAAPSGVLTSPPGEAPPGAAEAAAAAAAAVQGPPGQPFMAGIGARASGQPAEQTSQLAGATGPSVLAGSRPGTPSAVEPGAPFGAGELSSDVVADGLGRGYHAAVSAPGAASGAAATAGLSRFGGSGWGGGGDGSDPAAAPLPADQHHAPAPTPFQLAHSHSGGGGPARGSSHSGGGGFSRLPALLTPASSAGASEAAAAHGGGRQLSLDTASSAGASEAEEPVPMHPLCPLHDSLLPLDTASLKSRQLSHSLNLLQHVQDDEDAAMSYLEAIARLAWSDEAAREELGELGAVESIVKSMREYLGSEGVQCNGCLALMALVRGEGEASDANRLRMADCGGVQVLADGMDRHVEVPMVQLSALLCLVPLALENTYLQALVARACLPAILVAIQQHPDELEVVSKGLIMLGVLGQGDEEAHEVIRQTLVERTPYPRLVALVLADLGTVSEDVLWSCLFSLAVIARDSSTNYINHLLELAAAGVLPALEAALQAYRESIAAQEADPDEMILRAGDFLVSVLRKARKLLWLRRTRRLTRLAIVGLMAVTAFRWLRHRAGGHRHGGGGR